MDHPYPTTRLVLKMSQIPNIISFIGFLAGAIPLVGLPSNPVIRVLVEIGIVMGVAGVIYALHYLIYGMIVQAYPPSSAEILTWMVMAMFVVSYAAFRLAGSLQKIQNRLSGKSSRITTFAVTFAAGLVLVIAAYLYVEMSVQSTIFWDLEVKRDTVYLGSATIISLATFGSLVTVRVLGSPKTLEPRMLGFVTMFGGVIAVIIIQSIIMYGACCGSMSTIGFAGLFFATAVALASIIIGFAMILESWFKDEKGSAKS